jgi:anti-sigma factor RsiW
MRYFDGEGDPAVYREVREHLRQCADCAAWFECQARFEQAVQERLAAGPATPALWARVLDGAGVGAPAALRRRVVGAMLAAAAALLLGIGLTLWNSTRSQSSELPALATGWHERLAAGQVRPDFESTSDEAVDRWLKARVSFPVHCPPRTDVNFAVRGAGVCSLKEQQEAAYIVGRVDDQPVSILVMDRGSLPAFPQAEARLRDGQHHHWRGEGYQTVSGVIAENLVVVVGSVPEEKLEKLLNAYGTYPD